MTKRIFILLKLLLAVLSFNPVTQIYGQLTMKDPLICHDKDNYLRCYNDGTYMLTFAKGKFKEFRTVDNAMKYSDSSRTITFLQKSSSNGRLVIDTIQMIRQPTSIILKKGASSLEINSFKNFPGEIRNYNIQIDSTKSWNPIFRFWLDTSYVEVDVSLDWKKWNWNIVVRENDRLFAINYQGTKHNRVESIFAIDNNLRYGTNIATSFKTAKKIWWLESSYVDTIEVRKNGTVVIGDIYPNKRYYYIYNKSGKLKTKEKVGELKLCDCD